MNKNKKSKPFECQIWFSPQWRMSSRQSKISMSKQMEIQTRSWYALCSVPLSPGSLNKQRAIMRTTTRSKEYLASGGYPQTQVIIDGKLGQATGRGTGGSVTIIVRSYVRTYSVGLRCVIFSGFRILPMSRRRSHVLTLQLRNFPLLWFLGFWLSHWIGR